MEKLAPKFPKPARFSLRAFCIAPMKLQMLKSESVAVLQPGKVRTLEAKAGSTPRARGRAWMQTRRRVLLNGGFECTACGRVHQSNEVDHRVPLEQGGSNELHNLQVLCHDCHAEKTANEQRKRLGIQS